MEYEKEVSYKIDLVNSALNNVKSLHLSENNDFLIDLSFNYKHYIKYSLKKLDCINIDLILTSDALQIDVDRVNEAFVWSDKQVIEDKNVIENFIKMLFTSTIKVKYCGPHYTKLYFFDDQRHCVKTLKYITGLYLKIGCKTKEYQPIYTK